MKKIKLIVSSFLLATVFSGNANANASEGQFFVHVNLGAASSKIKNATVLTGITDTSYTAKNRAYAFVGGMGYHVLDELRWDASLYGDFENKAKHKTSVVSGATYVITSRSVSETMGVFTNLYYDVTTGTPFVPFVSVGVGMLSGKFKPSLDVTTNGGAIVKYTGANSRKTSIAYKLGAGMSYRIATGYNIDLGYNVIQPSISKKKKNYKAVDLTVGGAVPATITVTGERTLMHSLMLGLRSSF